MAALKDLSDEAKTFIVTQLACWAPPSDVQKAVREEFKVEITRQSIENYDPTKAAGKALSKRWRTVFEETRKRYLSDTAAIGIAQPTFRLRALERMFFKAEGLGNMGMSKELLEQAAKEVGGAFNKAAAGRGDGPDPIRDLYAKISGTGIRPKDG